MGTIFTLTDDIKDIASKALDDLVTELGKNCRLIYPPRQVPCVNCVSTRIGNKTANAWVHGGPMPFPSNAICPMCNGAGLRAEEHSDVVKMLIAWKVKDWYLSNLPPGIQVSDGIIQTKGFMYDINKVLQAREMIIETPLENQQRFRFFLQGEPIDASNIIQQRYFIAIWKRGGG